MHNIWKVPISTQHSSRKWVAHLMPNSMDTDKIYPTLCGMSVNPGFAVPASGTIEHCKKCEREAT